MHAGHHTSSAESVASYAHRCCKLAHSMLSLDALSSPCQCTKLCWAADSWLESQWGAADQTVSTQEAGTPASDDADPTQQETQNAPSAPASSRHMYTKLAQHAERAGRRAGRLGRAAVADGSRVGAAIRQEARRLQGAAEADILRWGGQVQVSNAPELVCRGSSSHDQSCCSVSASVNTAHAQVHMIGSRVQRPLAQ